MREKLLKQAGYRLVTKWACEFVKDKKHHPELFPEMELEKNITWNQSYFGGRTNVLVLHRSFTENEKAYYVDFTSLYPDVLKYKKYPVGHYKRVTRNFESVQENVCELRDNCMYPQCSGIHKTFPYFGVAKVKVLPPQDLHIPVLPVKINGKLKFPLCYTCVQMELHRECHCPAEKRMFTQTYCTPEIEAALNMGYTLIKVYEVLHWDEWEQYNPSAKKGGIFTEYINTFLRLKQQASGLPSEIDSSEDTLSYIQDYFVHEGIELQQNQIEFNPGLRMLAKLALNSFYGKFGQRSNRKKSHFIQEEKQLFNILTDVTNTVQSWHIINEDLMLLETTQSEEFENWSVAGNVFIAAMCTCWAHLKLWSVMVRLGERVLYHDTDSIIFSAKPGEYMPPLGSHLGELTSELECQDVQCNGCNQKHYITEFVGCGPKNYAYKTDNGHCVVKVRGFSLNHKTSLLVNFDTMKEALYSWLQGQPIQFDTVSTLISRNKIVQEVFNTEVTKHYGVQIDKRVVMNDLSTRPFGFKCTVCTDECQCVNTHIR